MLGGIVTCEIIFPAVLTLCVRRQNKIDGSFYECIPSLPQIFHCVVAEQFRLHSHSLDGLHQCIYAYGGELQQDVARQVPFHSVAVPTLMEGLPNTAWGLGAEPRR